MHGDDDDELNEGQNFEAEFEAELLQQQQTPINAVQAVETTLPPLTTVGRPTRPSRPTKPPHKPIKWPNFHLVDQQPSGSGANAHSDEKKASTQTHFVSIKAPQDPRPNLTT